MARSLFGGELPENLVKGLAAENFKDRESSQKKLLEWAFQQDGNPALDLWKLSKKSDDPEVRLRCMAILKGLSDRDYLSDGQGFLGITMMPEIVKLPGEENQRPAVRISNLVKNGPAERFGLKVGDSIVSLNGAPFKGDEAPTGFSIAIMGMKPLDKAVLGIKRLDGKLENVEVVLARHPGQNLSMFPGDLHLLDERARDRHFETWLKNLAQKGE